MNDDTTTGAAQPGPTPEAETVGWTETKSEARASQAREWMAQLQSMIENLAEQAGPVIRDVGIKAAELAALAGEKAGPVAQRAAEVTAEAGHRLAEKSRDLAAELRRERDSAREGEAAGAETTDVGAEPVGTAAGDGQRD